MVLHSRRFEILRRVERGEMDLSEAARRLEELDLDALEGELDETAEAVGRDLPAAPAPAPVGPLEPSTTIELPAAPAPAPSSPLEPSEPPAPEIRPEAAAQADAADQPRPETAAPDETPRIWRGWWAFVFIPGLLLVVAAVNWMYEGFAAGHSLGWGVWLSFIPLALGVLLLWLGWELRRARWMRLHITQRPGASPREIDISMPLPVGLTRWGMRTFGKFAPSDAAWASGGVLDELDQAVAADGGVHIQVEERGGQSVELWIDGPRS